MIRNRTAALEIYTGLAVALLLLSAGLSGGLVFALAFVLLVIGLAAFPEMRRPAILAATLAAFMAGAVVVLLRGGV